MLMTEGLSSLDAAQKEIGPVLVVEDDPLVGRSVTRWLSDHGWPTVLAASADDALLKAREADPVVAICDVDLGGGPDGIWLASQLVERQPGVSIIFATGHVQLPGVAILKVGVTGYLVKPYGRSELLEMVERAAGEAWVMRRAKKQALELILELVERRIELHAEITRFLGRAGDSPHPAADAPGTQEASQRPPVCPESATRAFLPGTDVARQTAFVQLGLRVASGLRIPEAERDNLRIAMMLCRLGFVALPPSVLRAPRPLGAAEWDVVRRHPAEGRSALELLGWPGPASLVGQMRERWDGLGYPSGLDGERISVGARVLAVVDAFDAMTSERPHRRALGWLDSIGALRRAAGYQFDPAVVDAVARELASSPPIPLAPGA
jgi:response regulator RpfG family c-di-GMP phosphodiesterase